MRDLPFEHRPDHRLFSSLVAHEDARAAWWLNNELMEIVAALASIFGAIDAACRSGEANVPPRFREEMKKVLVNIYRVAKNHEGDVSLIEMLETEYDN